jgi:hypothetical protein
MAGGSHGGSPCRGARGGGGGRGSGSGGGRGRRRSPRRRHGGGGGGGGGGGASAGPTDVGITRRGRHQDGLATRDGVPRGRVGAGSWVHARGGKGCWSSYPFKGPRDRRGGAAACTTLFSVGSDPDARLSDFDDFSTPVFDGNVTPTPVLPPVSHVGLHQLGPLEARLCFPAITVRIMAG